MYGMPCLTTPTLQHKQSWKAVFWKFILRQFSRFMCGVVCGSIWAAFQCPGATSVFEYIPVSWGIWMLLVLVALLLWLLTDEASRNSAESAN
jgi:uncharacterized membrane protein